MISKTRPKPRLRRLFSAFFSPQCTDGNGEKPDPPSFHTKTVSIRAYQSSPHWHDLTWTELTYAMQYITDNHNKHKI